MKHLGLSLAGIVAALALSVLGLVLAPLLQLGRLEPLPVPPGPAAQIALGAKIYRAEGCAECHTQQLRSRDAEAAARGWGPRRTVPRDYAGEAAPALGALRVGPDLANVGRRRPDAAWQLLHLYAPAAAEPGSAMPPYAFLFRVQKVGAAPSSDALRLPPPFAPAPGLEVVPTPEAQALAAYLLSLDHGAPLPEAGR